MDVLELTIAQLDVALAAGIIAKYEILVAAEEHGADDAGIEWLADRIV